MPAYNITEGDAVLNIGSWARAETFDACLCDPPYGFTAFTHKRRTMSWEREDVPSTSVWDGVYHVLRPGALLVAASGARLYHRMATRIEDAGFRILDQFIWAYAGANATGVIEGQRLRPAFEPYVVAWKPQGKVGRRFAKLPEMRCPTDLALDPMLMAAMSMKQPNVEGMFFCGKATPTERAAATTGNDHPTLKPLALTEHLAKLLLKPGAKRILVPFSGVGSEMIGCLRAGWPEVYGLEREAKYVKVARKRIPLFVEASEIDNGKVMRRAA